MSHSQNTQVLRWICAECNGAFPKGEIYGSLCLACAESNLGPHFQLGDLSISIKEMLDRLYSDERYSPSSRPRYAPGCESFEPSDSDAELDLSLTAICSQCYAVDPRSDFFGSLCNFCAETRAHSLFNHGEVRILITELLYVVYQDCDLLGVRPERAPASPLSQDSGMNESWSAVARGTDEEEPKQVSHQSSDEWVNVDKSDRKKKAKGWGKDVTGWIGSRFGNGAER